MVNSLEPPPKQSSQTCNMKAFTLTANNCDPEEDTWLISVAIVKEALTGQSAVSQCRQ
jgi:hypothetical protein